MEIRRPPTSDELTVAATLLEQQRRRATVDHQELRDNQTGTAEVVPISLGTTPGARMATRGTTPISIAPDTTRAEPNPLGEILAALGDTQVIRTEEAGETQRERSRQTKEQMANREKDQSFLLRAARMAMERGAQAEADALLRSLAALFPPTEVDAQPTKQNKETNPREDTTTATETGAHKTIGPILKEGGVSFIRGEIPDHAYCGLPSFYNKNVKAMKGSIPLTIFDPKWQQQAAAHQAERKTMDKGNTEDRRYTGHPAPGEWTQSYAQWSRNYQSFIGALRDVYMFKTISEWFKIHKDRCDEIMRREGFCPGFRYDLAVRANTFQCDMIRSNTSVFADVSQYRTEIAYKTLAEAQHNGEIGYIDNPYLTGGKKENFNPYTGAEKYPNPNQQTRFYNDGKGKFNGQLHQQKQGRRWDPYNKEREDEGFRGRNGGGEGPRYRENREERDREPYRPDSDNAPRDGRSRDRVKHFKSQQFNAKDHMKHQGKQA